MGLTTDTRVWKVLSVIFIILTLFFTLCLYFESIFITIVAGISLILITDKVLGHHKERIENKDFTKTERKLYGFAVFFFWVFIIIFLMGNSIEELGQVIRAQEEISTQAIANLTKYVPIVEDYLPKEFILEIQSYIIKLISNFLSQISFFVFNGVLIIPLMFYMYYRRREEIVNSVALLVPKKYYEGAKRAWKDISKQLYDYFASKVVESTVIAGICCLGYYVAGLKGWLVLGALAGFLNIIPYIGPIIGAVPALIIALLDEPIIALYVLVTVLIAQLVDNFYLLPFMISSKVKVDPLLSILLVLMGAQLLGVIGMVFALPIYLVYKIVLRESYKELT